MSTAYAWKNTMNSSIGSVGFLLIPFAKSTFTNIVKVNKRTTCATFTVNLIETITICYSPTNIQLS